MCSSVPCIGYMCSIAYKVQHWTTCEDWYGTIQAKRYSKQNVLTINKPFGSKKSEGVWHSVQLPTYLKTDSGKQQIRPIRAEYNDTETCVEVTVTQADLADQTNAE